MKKTGKNFTRYFSAFVFVMTLLLFPSLSARAEFDISAYVQGDSQEGGHVVYTDGISVNKSGYLVYVVDSNGNAVSPDAKLVSSRGYTFKTSGNVAWDATSRLGGYSVNDTTPIGAYNVPWGAPMTSEAGFNTREPDIKAWFSTTDEGGISNAFKVVQGYFSQEIAEAWVSNGYYLILEPIYEYSMWYKYNITVTYNHQTLANKNYISNRGAPTIVGTAKGCASLSNTFLSSLQPVTYSTQYGGENSYAEVKITYGTSFTASGMASGYARAFPRMEYLTRQIGSLRAGSAGTSYLSVDAITGNTGWGMIALSASGSDIIDPPVPPEDDIDPEPKPSYDGTIFTLTSTGGSTSSDGQSFAGGGVGTTTNFGNGYSESVCAIGSFYAENCATGDDLLMV